MLHFYGFFNASLFSLYISIHNLKYLENPIKCLEMRAKIKSVRKINEIFLCIFNYIRKSDIFSKYLNFDKKYYFAYFNSQISKCHIYEKFVPHFLDHKKLSGQNDNLTLHCNHPVSSLFKCLDFPVHVRLVLCKFYFPIRSHGSD